MGFEQTTAGLIFDEPTHTYFWNGEKKRSVTKILELGGLVDTRWFKEFHAARGSAVHKAANLLINNQLDRSSLHPFVKPFIDNFESFLKFTKFRPMLEFCEQPMYNDEYDYVGTPDLVGWLNSELWIIDLKTGSSNAVGPQLSGYANMPQLKKFNLRRGCLELNDKGRLPKLKEYSNPNDFFVFLDCLRKANAIGSF